MRSILLLFCIFTVANFANANPILEYFLTMSYIEGGMAPCTEIDKQIEQGKREQLIQILKLTLGTMKDCSASMNINKITTVLDNAVNYCKEHPDSTFGIALVNAVKTTNLSSFECRAASTIQNNAIQSSTLSNYIKRPQDKQSYKKQKAQEESIETNRTSNRSRKSTEGTSNIVIIE